MLTIFKSNQMENLMDALVSILEQGPDDPVAQEWIGIQSRGMKQWITLQAAARLGVCANINFVFPRQMIDHILNSTRVFESSHKNPVGNLTKEYLFWAVLRQIYKKDDLEGLYPVGAYIEGDGSGAKTYQFAMKAAALFDDYQIYRPDMLLDWESGKGSLSGAASWQSVMWKNIVSHNADHYLPKSALKFITGFDPENIDRNRLPEQMSLFGISSIPNLFMDIFEKISEIIDINLFFLVPSDQYFFDLKSSKQIDTLVLKAGKNSDLPEYHFETANPLLSSMGEAVKGFCSYLENFNYIEPGQNLFLDPLPDISETKPVSMLKTLQSDIFNLTGRQGEKDRIKLSGDLDERDVQIHACHSPMREAQVLKDILLNEFDKNRDLSPHDVIVMMPDIESYAPYISSVFNVEPVLPFTIADRRKRSESEVIEAFLKIFELKNSRLEKRQVLDLLLSEPIADKFNISLDQIPDLEKMVENSKILWGKDKQHRQSFELPPYGENTWETGLQRLFMGMAMPENNESIVQGILPCEYFEGRELDLLGSLAGFCSSLFSSLDMLYTDKTVKEWADTFRRLACRLLDQNYKNSEDFNFLFSTIDSLAEESEETGFEGKISFDVITAVLEQKLDLSIAQGSFMAGRITFCNIMPMRSIPFKIVALMGMDEAAFPRKIFSPGFDLMKKKPRPGDKNSRNEDLYMFLEALLSARESFFVTYTGISIQDNSLIPCSTAVSELVETVTDSFLFINGESAVRFHPLHPFDRSYFNQDPGFKSFSKDHCDIARTLSQKTDDPYAFIQQNPVPDRTEDRAEVQLDDLIYFFRNPVKAYMQNGLNLKLADIEEQALDRESFSLSGLDRYVLGNTMLKKNLSDSQNDLYPLFKAAGCLPFGEKGRLDYEKLQTIAQPIIYAAQDMLKENNLPALRGKVVVRDLVVSGSISAVSSHGQCFLNFGKLNGPRFVQTWVNHLFYNMVKPKSYPDKTILIGQDPDGKEPVKKYIFKGPGPWAEKYFADLVDIFINGQQKPFHFFCKTSLEFVKILLKSGGDLSPENISNLLNKAKVRDTWHGNMHISGEKQDRYLSLCFKENDPFESIETVMNSGFVENSIAVYKPLMENMEVLP